MPAFCQSTTHMESLTPPPWPELHLNNLRALKVLGKGGMGTVFLVHDISTDPSARSPFALKVLDKSSINSHHTTLDADRRARWEIQVLTLLSHPFLPSLLGTVESDQLLGWAVPYCPGGDLHRLLHRQVDRVFSPAIIRFYLAEILCALDHLHGIGVAYRDLKPENVLIQQSGHVTLTDFDLSHKLNPKSIRTVISSTQAQDNFPEIRRKNRRNLRRWFPAAPENKKGLKKAKSSRVSPVSRRKLSFSSGEKSNSFVGTEEYVSPEVVRGDGHEFAVDWWALGILAYELSYGTTPFKGSNRKETFRNVLLKTPEFIGKRSVLTDLIERLLEKDPTKRLGYVRGACEIREHEFFRGVQWDLLMEVVRPPFIPPREDSVDLTASAMDITDYFRSLNSPPSFPASPSSEYQRNISYGEF
ncbi:hypothetical protein QN277_007967 [Acacia crassicarpa]|uniref:non-specific serine/threonine protein kinase n=2 Tax=Acacia crassicarpa TaxID=499986 RepID=A0AAE1MCM4_9FABA|nr:hypothetical protein QN277_007967 [Acacia crassicarpa]